MDITKFDLRASCRVNTNEDGDRFVGVKIENDQAIIYFPLGYQLPDDDRVLRKDIRALFGILSTFSNKEDKVTFFNIVSTSVATIFLIFCLDTSTKGAKWLSVIDCPPYWQDATWAMICVATLQAVANDFGDSI